MEELRAALAALEVAFGVWVVDPLSAVIFFDLWFWDAPGTDGIALPIVVVWLILGASFFTLRFGFVNLRCIVGGSLCSETVTVIVSSSYSCGDPLSYTFTENV